MSVQEVEKLVGMPISQYYEKSNRDYEKEEEQHMKKIEEKVCEFTFIDERLAKKMFDLTPEEIQMWLNFTKSEDINMFEQLDPNNIDFFNPDIDQLVDDDGIYIRRWRWAAPGQSPLILIDMYSFPGDNQAGAVFIDGKMIYKNSDENLYLPEIPNLEHPLLNERIDTFDHVRRCFYDEDCEYHHHCNIISNKLPRPTYPAFLIELSQQPRRPDRAKVYLHDKTKQFTFTGIKRGDIVVTLPLEYNIYNGSYYNLIAGEIPNEFQVITEFPINYWSEIQIDDDHTRWPVPFNQFARTVYTILSGETFRGDSAPINITKENIKAVNLKNGKSIMTMPFVGQNNQIYYIIYPKQIINNANIWSEVSTFVLTVRDQTHFDIQDDQEFWNNIGANVLHELNLTLADKNHLLFIGGIGSE